MRADALKLEELVTFGQGAINLQGRRLVLHSIDAFAQFRKDLMDMVGPDQTRRILTRFGYFWGHADGAAMKRIFQWDNTGELLKAQARIHTLWGAANMTVKELELDEETGRLHMEVVWRDSAEAEEHLLAAGRSEDPVCWMLAAHASGYVSFCLGRDVYFVEQKCRARGDGLCTAVGRDVASWGDAIQPYLPYYRADDIQGKVLSLTEELKQKTRELADQRKRLDALERRPAPFLVEVHSRVFQRVMDIVQRVARFDTSVLITGETGTGKEVVARSIHSLSPRSKGSFLAVNCGALPETLLESELFGHKAGAFTGATRDRAGLFEEAKGGTLFLDEIGDISPAMQARLLRVLQNREILRVGESRPRPVDARIVAATNRDLDEAVRTGAFREDLLYRLRIVEIEVPPLRERPEDILPLARHFVERLRDRLSLPELRLDASCLNALQAYAWPGNVRELENAIERAAVLSHEGDVLPEYLPRVVTDAAAGARSADPLSRTLEQVERDHIRTVLERLGGNRTRAAAALGVSPSTLWRKLKGMEAGDS